jgi:hypothetical protein
MREEDAAAAEPSDPREDRQLAEFDAFVRATQVALERGVPLHVSMAPPGHTDFGFYTVFAHCPLCKVGARGSSELYTCHVCATQYRPVASSERMEPWSGGLRSVLGAAFEQFAERYLVESGFTEAESREIVLLTEAGEVERKRKGEEIAARWRRNDAYVRAVLFAGLHPSYVRTDEGDEPAEGAATESTTAMFSAAEFAELLARCERDGITLTSMFHHAADEEMERSAFRVRRPSQQLAAWLAEGCSERFSATFRVPDELIPASK